MHRAIHGRYSRPLQCFLFHRKGCHRRARTLFRCQGALTATQRGTTLEHHQSAATAEGFPPVTVLAMPIGVRTPLVVFKVNADRVDAPLLVTYIKSVGSVSVLPRFVPVAPATITKENGVKPVEIEGVLSALSAPVPGA